MSALIHNRNFGNPGPFGTYPAAIIISLREASSDSSIVSFTGPTETRVSFSRGQMRPESHIIKGSELSSSTLRGVFNLIMGTEESSLYLLAIANRFFRLVS
jgi:hypothetical protein